MLEANEIAAFIPDENTIQMDWAYLNAIGGVRIQIPEEDRKKALSVLAEFRDNLNRETRETEDRSKDHVSSEKSTSEIASDSERPPWQASLEVIVLVVLPLVLIAAIGFPLWQESERHRALDQGTAAYNGKNYDLAIEDFNRVIQLGDKSGWIYCARGNAYESRGTTNKSPRDYDRAIVDFGKAIELEPQFFDAYENRADTYEIKGEYDKAIADYSIAIQLNPSSSQSYVNRGYAHQQKSERAEAIADYNQALLLDPKNESSYANLGIVYNDLGSYDLAISDYSRALQLDPKDENAYIGRASAYCQKDDWNRAISDYNQALLLNPQDSQVFNYRGDAYASLGHNEQALADFNQSIRINPNDEDANNNFAWFLATCPQTSMRDGKRAVKLATKACELSAWKGPGVMDTLAAAYAETGDFVNAVKCESSHIASLGEKSPKLDAAQKRLALYKNHQPYRKGK